MGALRWKRHIQSFLLERHPLVFDGLEQLIEGGDKLVDPLFLELAGDLLVADPNSLECRQSCPGFREVLFSGEARVSMVAEALQCLERHRVHGIGGDQLLDVQDITVGRILRAGTGP